MTAEPPRRGAPAELSPAETVPVGGEARAATSPFIPHPRPAPDPPPAPGVRVHGGAGGTVAQLEEMAAAGRHLESVAVRVGVAAGQVSLLTASPALIVTAWRSPFTAAAAERALIAVTAGPRGLVAGAVRLGVLAEALRHAVDVYRAWDEATRLLFDQIALTAGRGAALFLGPALAVGGATVAMMVIGSNGEGGSPGGVAGALLGLLVQDTRLLEPFMAALPGAVGGVLPVAEAPWGPPTNLGGAAGIVATVGVLGGVFRESGQVRISSVTRTRGAAPTTLPAVLGSIRGAAPEPTVRVVRVRRGASSSWIVAVPGTRTWAPRAGSDPFDLTGDLRAVAGQNTAAREAVLAAMRAAGIRKGEPVMLAGYSQGGIVVGSLAEDPAVRRQYDVTHVLTAGAPIGGFDIPPDVQVLSLENDEDPVPGLEGRPNPDLRTWTTVSRDIEQDLSDAALLRTDPLAGHRLDVYARTASAAEASGSRSVAEWRRGAGVFFDGPGVATEVIDVVVTRKR